MNRCLVLCRVNQVKAKGVPASARRRTLPDDTIAAQVIAFVEFILGGLSVAHSRRTWMKTAAMGLGGLLASERNLAAQQVHHGCALADPRDEIKITGLEIIPVNSLRTIFVKMNTNAGITGIGEGTVEGRIPTVVAAIKEIEPYVIGKDARRPAHHWQAIYRHAIYRGDIVLTSALGAVDIAMWDIKGKALGVPIYDLLGGPP